MIRPKSSPDPHSKTPAVIDSGGLSMSVCGKIHVIPNDVVCGAWSEFESDDPPLLAPLISIEPQDIQRHILCHRCAVAG